MAKEVSTLRKEYATRAGLFKVSICVSCAIREMCYGKK